MNNEYKIFNYASDEKYLEYYGYFSDAYNLLIERLEGVYGELDKSTMDLMQDVIYRAEKFGQIQLLR